jgi:probable phosphoglycerate mutase
MTCHLILVRHGETDWNAARRIQGSLDIPLNETGRRQARSLAAALREERLDAAWASDLARAVETARTLVADRSLRLRTTPDLRERCYGDLEGLTVGEARERFPTERSALERRDPDFAPPGGGESLRQLDARVARALDRIADAHARALVVAHGGVLDAAYRRAAGLPLEAPRDFPIGNATLNRIARENGRWRIVSWDERAHVETSRDEVS